MTITDAPRQTSNPERHVPTRRVSFEESLRNVPKHFAADGDLSARTIVWQGEAVQGSLWRLAIDGDRLAAKVALPSGSIHPLEIVERVVQLIRGFRGLGPSQKIDTPVALAFSKIDAVRSLIDPGSPIHRAANHDGYFDLNDAEELSESMRAHVAKWVGPGFDAAIRHNFKNPWYFGLSALGASPDPQGRLPAGATPFRVEDPLLWILRQRGIIPARRMRR